MMMWGAGKKKRIKNSPSAKKKKSAHVTDLSMPGQVTDEELSNMQAPQQPPLPPPLQPPATSQPLHQTPQASSVRMK